MLIFTKQPPTRTKQLRHDFKHNHVTRKFLLFLDQNGYLDRIYHRIDMNRLYRGKVPKGFDIHHIIPLSGGGTNSFSNLCLIEKSFHRFLNKYCFDVALKHIQVGETVAIDIPDLPPVALHNDYSKFIQDILKSQPRQAYWKKILRIPLRFWKK